MSSKSLRSIMSWRILSATIFLLLTPYSVWAEATHSGTFALGIGTKLQIYENLTSHPQNVMVTVCLKTGTGIAQVDFLDYRFLVSIIGCRSGFVRVPIGGWIRVTGYRGTPTGSYAISTSLR